MRRRSRNLEESNIYVTLKAQGELITGHYRGGHYIDIHSSSTISGPAIAVIGAWDYSQSKRGIENTRAGVSEHMKEWRQDLYPTEIRDCIDAVYPKLRTDKP